MLGQNIMDLIFQEYKFYSMQSLKDDDPFQIIKNYRKMRARRDKDHKKRKPKQYPPTNIKTRSMEQKKQRTPSREYIQFQEYSQSAPSNILWDEAHIQELSLLAEDQRLLENSIEILDYEDKLKPESLQFYLWENEVSNDLNEQELLPIL